MSCAKTIPNAIVTSADFVFVEDETSPSDNTIQATVVLYLPRNVGVTYTVSLSGSLSLLGDALGDPPAASSVTVTINDASEPSDPQPIGSFNVEVPPQNEGTDDAGTCVPISAVQTGVYGRVAYSVVVTGLVIANPDRIRLLGGTLTAMATRT